MATTSDDAIRVSGMEFSYDAEDPIFFDFNLELPAGSRCLLVGANGSGTFIDLLQPEITACGFLFPCLGFYI